MIGAARGLNKICGVAVRVTQGLAQIGFHLRKDCLTRRAGVFERRKAFVIPVKQHGLCAVFEIRNVDLNGRGLADAVQPTDTLFQQIRIEWQVK